MDSEKAEKLIKQTQAYARTILNSLSAHIAIIDENGRILETNQAWNEFARSNQIDIRPSTPDINYLDICESARDNSADNADNADTVARGIRRVINGEIDEFTIDYPCHSPGEKRWFYMRVTKAAGSDPVKVVISHENITALKLAQEKLTLRETELKQKSGRLEEANAALNVILRQRDEDRKQLEQTIFQNLREVVLPNIERMKCICRTPEAAGLMDLIDKGLQEIASPFLSRLGSLGAILSPQELRIATLIKEGKSTKEIADLLNLSTATINFHRRNLRKKLELTSTGLNLRSFLLSLSE
ncbi:MAG: helix-turn-helix transcriptional regulator [Desulfobacteraceae bacterium]|nr:helix-turn-helix transcriptional regulator [Desulfobacteraceae bacterium]